jgi:hypothetical protein
MAPRIGAAASIPKLVIHSLASDGSGRDLPITSGRATTSFSIRVNFKRKYLLIIQAKTNCADTVINPQRSQIITRQRAYYDKRKDDVDK